MDVGASSWEKRLVALAQEGLQNGERHDPLRVESSLRAEAYRYCTQIARAHSHTFYLASGLLPREKRRATRALYAFCRVSDDLVDASVSDRRGALEEWRECVMRPDPPKDRPVALAWADTRRRFGIPVRCAEQLLDGIAQDLTKTRYQTFSELATYCYGVASTVGLMAMHITGFSGAEAIPYAVKMGLALQLTNILRDVGEDWRAGRLYLPEDELAAHGLDVSDDELAAHGLDVSDIAEGRVDDRWRRFLRAQIQRTRCLYRQALPGVAYLHRSGRFAVAAAAELYRGILDDIEVHDGDVFTRRAHVSDGEKLRRLPGVWWRATTGGYSRG